MFNEFMNIIQQEEEEKGIAFVDFTEEDFFDIQENCPEEMFSDPQVQAKLRECGCVKSVTVDEDDEFITIELKDGSVGEFPVY